LRLSPWKDLTQTDPYHAHVETRGRLGWQQSHHVVLVEVEDRYLTRISGGQPGWRAGQLVAHAPVGDELLFHVRRAPGRLSIGSVCRC
jgi:hypothetical protein